MAETTNTPPAGGDDFLADVPQAEFNMDALVDETKAKPKQKYDQALVDDDDDDDPSPETRAGTVAQNKARESAANVLMMMLDRTQAGIFTLFGAAGHAEDFRFNEDERLEMAGYLEEGLPADFRMPWWIPFLLVLVSQFAINMGKLKEIRETKRKAAELSAAKHRKEQLDSEATELRTKADVLRLRAEAQERARAAQRDAAAAAPAAEPAKVPEGAKDTPPRMCPQCNKKAVPAGKEFCSPRCKGDATRAKNKKNSKATA